MLLETNLIEQDETSATDLENQRYFRGCSLGQFLIRFKALPENVHCLFIDGCCRFFVWSPSYINAAASRKEAFFFTTVTSLRQLLQQQQRRCSRDATSFHQNQTSLKSFSTKTENTSICEKIRLAKSPKHQKLPINPSKNTCSSCLAYLA